MARIVNILNGAYQQPTTPQAHGEVGILRVRQWIEALDSLTDFVSMTDYGDATGVVFGYDPVSRSGKILGLTAGTLQAYFDSDGKLKWAGGKGILDATGLAHEQDANTYFRVRYDADRFLDLYHTRTDILAGEFNSSRFRMIINAPSNSAANFYAHYAHTKIPATNAVNYTGWIIPWFVIAEQEGSGNLDYLVANWARVRLSGSGVVSNAYGVVGQLWITGSGTISEGMAFLGSVRNDGSGTITNGYGVYSVAYNTAGGAFDTFYAFYMPLVTNVTRKYGLYITDPGADNYIAGSLTVGGASTLPGYLKADGSVPGATGQAQALAKGTIGPAMTPDVVMAAFSVPAAHTALYNNMQVPPAYTVEVAGLLVDPGWS